MDGPDVSQWAYMGRTSTGSIYQVEPGIVGVVAVDGARDDEATALENVELYHRHCRDHGPGVFLFFVDHVLDQNARARRVYQEQTDPALVVGVVIVARSLMARAIGSFFLGVSRPRMPFKVAGSFQDALTWARLRLSEVEELIA